MALGPYESVNHQICMEFLYKCCLLGKVGTQSMHVLPALKLPIVQSERLGMIYPARSHKFNKLYSKYCHETTRMDFKLM